MSNNTSNSMMDMDDEDFNLSNSFNNSIFKDKINPNSSLYKSINKNTILSNSLITSSNNNNEGYINFYKKNHQLKLLERDITDFLEIIERQTNNKLENEIIDETEEEKQDKMNISISFLSDANDCIRKQREYIEKLEIKIRLDSRIESDLKQQSIELSKTEKELSELKQKYNQIQVENQLLFNKAEESKLNFESNERLNQTKIANKNMEMEELIKKIKFLSNNENELQNKLKELENKYQDLERNTQLKIKAIEKEKMNFRTEIVELKHKSPMNSNNYNNNNNVLSPNNDLKIKDSEIKHLKTVNRQFEEQIKQQKQTLESTLKKLNDLENQIEKYSIPSSSSLSSPSSSSSPSSNDQKLKDNDNIIQSLKSEITYYKQLNQDSSKEVERLKKLSENLGNLELIKQQNDSYKDKIQRLEMVVEKYNSLQVEYSNLLQEKSKDEKNLEQNKDEIVEQLKQKIIKLENDNQLLVSKIGDLTANWKLVQVRNSDYKEEAELEKETNSNKEKRINELTEKIKRIEKSNYLLKRERDNFKNILDAYDNDEDYDNVSDPTKQEESRIHLKNERIKELERALKEKSMLLEEYEDKFGGSGSGFTSPPKSNENDKLLIEQLKDEISKLNKEVVGLTQENAILENRLGKGEYDSNKIKVLHFKDNPTSPILNPPIESVSNTNNVDVDKKLLEENHRLQYQINESEKKLDRLKLMFKQKINEFREGVYALLGYKIDVSTDNTYKLQSMYAESENDYLIFKNNVQSGSSRGHIQMELLETDFTRNLDKEIKAYLLTCKSIPSFLSQVTIDLFSRQTFHP